MKRISLGLISTLSCSLVLGLACDLEKEDGADTGAVGDDDFEDDGDSDESESEDSVSTSAGTSPGDDDGDSDSDSDDTVGTSVGGDDDGDSDSDDGQTTGDSEGGDGEPNAFAIAHADLPELDPGGESSSTVGGDEDDIPPDAVHVTISGSGVATCEMPYEGEPCGGNWSVSFLLMPAMLEGPGTYNLFEEANGFQTYADEPYEEGDCGWGGGTLDGVLVIEEITDDAIIGHLEDTDAFDFDADMDFEASFCG